jgi:c-di-GMP-binding flagellar brake protein YcgR
MGISHRSLWDAAILPKEVVETGLVVHLEVARDETHRSFNGYIANISPDGMGVQVPEGEEIAAHFSDGIELLISAQKEGVGLVGRTRVTDQVKDNDRVIKVSVPESWKRVQRRKDYRIDVNVPDAVLTVQNSTGSEQRMLRAEITNLSAGGAVARVPKNLPTTEESPGLSFRLDFALNMEDPLGDKRPWEKLWSGPGPGTTKVSLTSQILEIQEDGDGSGKTELARCDFGLEFSRTGDLIREFLNQYQRVENMRKSA